jgi:hypothetical protein
VLVDYCDDISDEAEQDGTIHLLDTDRIEAMLAEVTDPNKRILTCVLAMDISKSDGTISDPEIVLLRHMMKEWNISLEDGTPVRAEPQGGFGHEACEPCARQASRPAFRRLCH